MTVVVIGGGIFGVTAAVELRARGHAVTLLDPGPLPHPLAESTDLSKVVRIDYGADVEYTELGERSLDGWRRWNRDWPTARFHETGVAFLSRAPMVPGGFEHESFALLSRRGHRLERLDAAAIARRFPAYRPGALVDGYTHAEGGWAESGAVVADLVAIARASGVIVRSCRVDRIDDDGVIADGERVAADSIVACAGAWITQLVPELAGVLHAIGQPVFHLVPPDPSRFEAARFPVFGADIARTGYYGFPLASGVVKIANHGTGIAMSPDEPRAVTAEQTAALRALCADVFPSLAGAPIAASRLCVYGDSRDGHFWIARHPERPNLTIACGGSGHAFKFAPVLGGLIADAMLGVPVSSRFRWRPEIADATRGDAARSS
jgi:glycine/D-amino acid oxidase-like deaminating enzyme